MIYVNSSVFLAHLLVEERRPTAVFWQQVSVSSRLLEYEVWNRIGVRGLGQSHREKVRASLAKIGMVELTPLSLRRAVRMIRWWLLEATLSISSTEVRDMASCYVELMDWGPIMSVLPRADEVME